MDGIKAAHRAALYKLALEVARAKSRAQRTMEVKAAGMIAGYLDALQVEDQITQAERMTAFREYRTRLPEVLIREGRVI